MDFIYIYTPLSLMVRSLPVSDSKCLYLSCTRFICVYALTVQFNVNYYFYFLTKRILIAIGAMIFNR